MGKISDNKPAASCTGCLAWGQQLPGRYCRGCYTRGETGETLVVVARTTTPMWQIVQRVESLQTERGRADTE
ncbi:MULTISPECIES: hypothetical protein [Streptomyces]|uniref:DUF1289 domain-containing protein n=2 Tax=Streptomyces TaxID=1883 RepID=A0ABV9J477_9ACTN